MYILDNIWNLNKISLSYVNYGLIDKKISTISVNQLMPWHRLTNDKPLLEQMLTNMRYLISYGMIISRPQWVKGNHLVTSGAPFINMD